MTVYIDPPDWPGHGRMWSHLVSDVSYAELHAFAAALGCPRRAFDRDHYDIPSAHYADAVRGGAVEVGPKELLRRLTQAGLRRPRRRPAPAADTGTGADADADTDAARLPGGPPAGSGPRRDGA